MTTPWSEPDALKLIEKYGPVTWDEIGRIFTLHPDEGEWMLRIERPDREDDWLYVVPHIAECILDAWAEKWLNSRGYPIIVNIDGCTIGTLGCNSFRPTKSAALIEAMKEIGK